MDNTRLGTLKYNTSKKLVEERTGRKASCSQKVQPNISSKVNDSRRWKKKKISRCPQERVATFFRRGTRMMKEERGNEGRRRERGSDLNMSSWHVNPSELKTAYHKEGKIYLTQEKEEKKRRGR